MTLVLYYHRVAPETFQAQMAALAKTRVLTLDQAAAGEEGVALTFDDGYRDCLDHAVPELRARRYPAAFFIVAGLVGRGDEWLEGRNRLMDWDELKRLRDEGFTLGSHSLTHAALTRAEVVESRRLLSERLGVPVAHFAYPRGEHGPEAVEWVREAGYAAGWATRSAAPGPFTRRRLPVSARLGPFRFRVKLLKARLGWYG